MNKLDQIMQDAEKVVSVIPEPLFKIYLPPEEGPIGAVLAGRASIVDSFSGEQRIVDTQEVKDMIFEFVKAGHMVRTHKRSFLGMGEATRITVYPENTAEVVADALKAVPTEG